jgi:hypothetical protein
VEEDAVQARTPPHKKMALLHNLENQQHASRFEMQHRSTEWMYGPLRADHVWMYDPREVDKTQVQEAVTEVSRLVHSVAVKEPRVATLLPALQDSVAWCKLERLTL